MATTTASPTPVGDDVEQPLYANLCWLLRQASHGMTVELTAALERLGISPRAHAVRTAATCGEQTQTELAQMVGLDKTTMVVMLDELEAAGLAERRPSSSDRRVRTIAVTRAGARMVREGERIADALTDDVLGTLPARERRAVLDALTRLVTGRLSQAAVCEHPPRRRALGG
ncbi:MAG TPA: MarR family winged helix-turn-helix transcriptional regulator [Conexibacter sp.]|nr:MarR family winged helix-turn-helix transcriptional regulator [Conexibacter sp.]